YLVDSTWFRKWKKYVGFNSWDVHEIGSHNIFLGPVDNSGLLTDELDIKEHLIDELDYILLPTEGWKKLVSWYGLKDEQEPIARKVVEMGMFVKHCKVEVYLIELKLCENSNMDKIVSRRFSKADTIRLGSFAIFAGSVPHSTTRVVSYFWDQQLRFPSPALWTLVLNPPYAVPSMEDPKGPVHRGKYTFRARMAEANVIVLDEEFCRRMCRIQNNWMLEGRV
ncbi:hypothetical protein QQF64_023980, partial [Cirrhinus molitorella]